MERQGEELVLGVLLIEHLYALLRNGFREVFLVVYETRLNGIGLEVDHLLKELAALVVVGGNRRDARLLNLVDGSVVALTLKHRHVVVEEEAIGKVDDLLACHLGNAVEAVHLIAPLLSVDESIHKLVGARTIVLQRTVIIELHVVDHSGQQVIGKLTLLELVDFGKHQLTDLLQALALLRHAYEDELSIVGHAHVASLGGLNLHRSVEVEVENTGLAVREHVGNDVERVGLVAGCSLRFPTHHEVFGLQSHNGGVDRSCQITHRRILGTAKLVVLLPIAKVLVDNGHYLIGVEIARHTDGHVVGNIVTVVVILDVQDRRILEMLLRTDSGLCAVWVTWEELCCQSVPLLVVILSQTYVEFLIHSFQLGVESTDNHVLETVAFDLRPSVDLVGRNVLHVASNIV